MRIGYFLVGLLLFLVGCQQASLAPSTTPVRVKSVVCTTGMLADIARQLVGQDTQVTALMGPGVDPHLYKATASDIVALQQADVVIYNGLHLEGKMVEIFDSLRQSGHLVLGAADGIDKARLRPIDGQGHYYDPHIWFDVALWSEVVDPIAQTLGTAYPSQMKQILDRAKELKEKLTKLDHWCRQELGQIPQNRRILVTSHDAFGYFGKAYQIEVVALQGVTTVAEASAADVAKLVDYLKARKIPAIFVESSVPKALMERVSQSASVKIGGELFSDALGPVGTETGNYFGMIKHNIYLVVKALK